MPNKEAMKDDRKMCLMQTIKVPKNLKNLDQRLPKSNYDQPIYKDIFQIQQNPQTPPQEGESVVRRKKRSLAPPKL
jgi:hypothetical protein